MKPALRALILLFVAAGLFACGSTPRRETPAPRGREAPRTWPAQDRGPDQAFDWTKVPEPAPRHEERARYGNHSPYTVLGKTYTVMDSASGYVERGIASWYGEKFHGKLTSTREPYDMYQYSAAHKTLPLPAWVRVTHLENGRSVVLRVNDRGPFHRDRIIDLSYVAAQRLGIAQSGTGPVEVRALDVAESGAIHTPSGEHVVESRPAGPRGLWLQTGAFREASNARSMLQRLHELGFAEARMERTRDDLFRVRVGPFDDVSWLDEMSNRLRDAGYANTQVSID
jgi:rare lipoprotein A